MWKNQPINEEMAAKSPDALVLVLDSFSSLFLFILFSWIPRAEGSSKVHSRLEQQTSRLSQQMRSNNNNSSSNKSSASSKSSPPKEKTSPASHMDDIERGNMGSGVMSSPKMLFTSICLIFAEGISTLAPGGNSFIA